MDYVKSGVWKNQQPSESYTQDSHSSPFSTSKITTPQIQSLTGMNSDEFDSPESHVYQESSSSLVSPALQESLHKLAEAKRSSSGTSERFAPGMSHFDMDKTAVIQTSSVSSETIDSSPKVSSVDLSSIRKAISEKKSKSEGFTSEGISGSISPEAARLERMNANYEHDKAVLAKSDPVFAKNQFWDIGHAEGDGGVTERDLEKIVRSISENQVNLIKGEGN